MTLILDAFPVLLHMHHSTFGGQDRALCLQPRHINSEASPSVIIFFGYRRGFTIAEGVWKEQAHPCSFNSFLR